MDNVDTAYPARIGNRQTEVFRVGNQTALDLVKAIEEAAREKDLPFVESAAELIADALEQGLLQPSI
jgi:hypothetical protein